MHVLLRFTLVWTVSGVLLSGCDISRLFNSNTEQQFQLQVFEVSQQVYELRLETQVLPGKDGSDLSEIVADANEISEHLSKLIRNPDPLRQPQQDQLLQYWQGVSRHAQELKLRETMYQTFLQQRATLSTQLAVLTDGIDKLAAALVQAKLPGDMIYQGTGMLYVNERMQYTLAQLSEQPSNTPLILDRLTRDVLLMKRYLGDLRDRLTKTRQPQRIKPIAAQVEKLLREFVSNGPLIEQVLENSSNYLDFLERHAKLQEMLEHTSEQLDQLREPPPSSQP
ncbi:MAG: hypothetical protein HY080_09620 [Gammaproteobacteria bacterium]|nr:hypothetical protein [Gammaproteobacteria bacterium]